MAKPTLIYAVGLFASLVLAAIIAVLGFGYTEPFGPLAALLVNCLVCVFIAGAGLAGFAMVRPEASGLRPRRCFALGALVGGVFAAWMWSAPTQLGLAGYAGAVLIVSFALGHLVRRVAT